MVRLLTVLPGGRRPDDEPRFYDFALPAVTPDLDRAADAAGLPRRALDRCSFDLIQPYPLRERAA